MQEDINELELERLLSQGKASAHATLTNLVALGGIFKAASTILEKDFSTWTERHFGKSFLRIAQKLIRSYDLFECMQIRLPEVTPDTLLSLMGEEMSEPTIRQIVQDHAVEVRGSGIKQLQDLSRPEIAQITARNKKLEEIVRGKENEVEALEEEIESLTKKLDVAARQGGKEEIEEMKRLLMKKEAEILRLRKKDTRDKKRSRKRIISDFKALLESPLVSEVADSLIDVAKEFVAEETDLLKSTIDSHEQNLKHFRNKVGIES